MGYCPNGCGGSLSVPLDEALGIRPHQNSSDELVRLGCLFSLFVPYELAAWLLGQFSGIRVSASSLWNWVEHHGQAALAELSEQLAQHQAGQPVEPESLAESLAGLPLLVAADGVMVPMRPHPKTPKGKTVWREIKVGVLARLGTRLNRSGESVSQLLQRRVVAVLGNLEQFIPVLTLEAHRQSMESAPKVIWLSDGGRGFWRVYHQCFAHCAVAILDFYHAAGHLWRAATALFNHQAGQRQWFKQWRHALRHGQHHTLLAMLTWLVNTDLFAGKDLSTLLQVQAYFQRHQAHIRYQHFDKQQLPLGSGMVESACKWLIQQRFKGVGMRWSEPGLQHLLILRGAWVNQRFDDCFPLVPKSSLRHPSNNT
ncbi:MAG: ISKra4 family transposase [Cyanobacteria bacterium J06635_1]